MKTRLFWVFIPAVIFTFGACKKSEESTKAATATAPTGTNSTETTPAAPASPADPATPAEPVKPAVPATPVAVEGKALSAEERAVKLGFVRYLPQDTESVISIYNGSKIGERAKNMKLWKIVEEGVGGLMGRGRQAPMMPAEGMGIDAKPMDEDFAIPEGEQEKSKPATGSGALLGAAAGAAATDAAGDAADEPAMDVVPPGAAGEDGEAPSTITPGDMLGLEVTFAVGKSAGEQLGNLVTLGNRLNYFQMRTLAKAYVAAVKAGDLSGMSSAMGNRFG